MKDSTHIVIIGGGFAGTATALNLEKTFRRDPSVEITLIDSENFFTFTPLLAEVPSGSIQPNHIVVPLRALLKRTKVKQAEVKSVDLKNRTVIAAHCGACGDESLPFDQLVLATGSVSNYFGLPGVAEYALTIKSLADATALHAHVIDKLEHADLQSDQDVRRQLLTFVVAGGGFAGVETLAELNDFVRGARKFYPNVSPEDVRMVLIHSGSHILPEVRERVPSAGRLRSSPSTAPSAARGPSGLGPAGLRGSAVAEKEPQDARSPRRRRASGRRVSAASPPGSGRGSPTVLTKSIQPVHKAAPSVRP